MNSTVNHSSDLAIRLCERHFGIGADGLIILEKSEVADFNMIFYNPDGSHSFCGNGSRCAVRFALHQGIIDKNETDFIAIDGRHLAHINSEVIKLQMNNPSIIPVKLLEKELPITNVVIVNTGSPHLIIFIDDKLNILEIDVRHFGAKIRYSETYKKNGINVNFVNIESENTISIRTYERGVEDETLSCGTGVTASAIAYHHLFAKQTGKQIVNVTALGGQLAVTFDFDIKQYSNTELCGPAELVYHGLIEI